MRRFDPVVRAAIAALVCAGCAASPADTDEPAGSDDSALMFGGAGPTTGAPESEPPVQTEPDGASFDRATVLAFGESPPFEHSKRGDRYFEIAVPEGSDGLLTITATAPSDESPAISFYDAKHERVAEYAPGTSSIAATGGKTYFVKVHGHATRPQYRLAVAFAAVTDPFEPNDAIASAARVASGEPIAVRMFAGHETNDGLDVDYFRVASVGKTTLRIQLANGEGGGQVFAAELIAAGEKLLGAAYSTGAAGDIDATFSLPNGTREVVVRLSGTNGAAASEATFTTF